VASRRRPKLFLASTAVTVFIFMLASGNDRSLDNIARMACFANLDDVKKMT
jgi:hypothetical protein